MKSMHTNHLTFLKTIKRIEKFKKKYIDSEYQIYKLCAAIEVSRKWQRVSFYPTLEIAKMFINSSFSRLLEKGLFISANKYRTYLRIVRLPEGEELLKTYGYENLATYEKASVTDRKLILEVAKNSPFGKSWSSIRFNKIHPRNPDTKININSEKASIPKKEKSEILSLKSENRKLKIRIAELEKENLKLREENTKLRNFKKVVDDMFESASHNSNKVSAGSNAH